MEPIGEVSKGRSVNLAFCSKTGSGENKSIKRLKFWFRRKDAGCHSTLVPAGESDLPASPGVTLSSKGVCREKTVSQSQSRLP